jgi:hypothetical protein
MIPMKISKKIFGVALALIMIFNVFAVGTFAAFPDDTVVKLMIRADKATYAPGDTVTLTLSEQVIAEVGTMMIGGQYELAYPTAVLSPISNSDVIENQGFVALQAGYDAGISGVQVPEFVASTGIDPTCVAQYGWDERICYAVGDDGVTTFDATQGADLFTVQFVIDETAADGTYYIGYNPLGYEECNAFSNDGLGLGGLYGTDGTYSGYDYPYMYEYGVCAIVVSSAPAVEVTHDGTQARYAYPGTPSAAAYQFGCLGKVTGLTVETDDANNVTNIQSIVATANYNGATVTSEVATMWVDGDAYGFRAVFRGFDYQDTKDISVTFAITMADGTTVYTTADAATYTANGIYTAAVGRGMPEIA